MHVHITWCMNIVSFFQFDAWRNLQHNYNVEVHKKINQVL